MMQKWIFMAGLLIATSPLWAQNKTAYIELYKDIAVSEMIRTGIPASIKLAQAILESNCGQSDLACKANNHFGIKCGNDWKGKTFRKEDDDYEEGKLVKSCFREFRNAYDSYIAHSDFLMDPAKARRYGSLFELESSDYKGWAKGLSKAGYATDPKYADRLIEIIERYKLDQYDMAVPDSYARSHKKKQPDRHRPVSVEKYHNDVRYVVAQEGDTPLSIADQNDVTSRQVVKYNDDIRTEDQALVAGTRVYLQPKRNQNHGKQKVHLLKSGDDLVSLSQLYGIRLDALLKRNGLREGDIPAPNQKIYLKGKAPGKLRTVNPYAPPVPLPENEPEPLRDEMTSIDKEEVAVQSVQEIKADIASIQLNKPDSENASHIVVKGDTLFSVSRQYGLPVSELKKMNNLSADTIFIGQKLILR
jgi:LysM repeat protein